MKILSFGPKLRALREAKQLGLRELAIKAGISQAFLSKVECGKEKPPAEQKLRSLAKVLGHDPEVLMTLAGRFPDDIVKIIQKYPEEYLQILRSLRKLDGVELRRVGRGLVLRLPGDRPSTAQKKNLKSVAKTRSRRDSLQRKE